MRRELSIDEERSGRTAAPSRAPLLCILGLCIFPLCRISILCVVVAIPTVRTNAPGGRGLDPNALMSQRVDGQKPTFWLR